MLFPKKAEVEKLKEVQEINEQLYAD